MKRARFILRLREDQKVDWEQYAAQNGVSLAELIRRCVDAQLSKPLAKLNSKG